MMVDGLVGAIRIMIDVGWKLRAAFIALGASTTLNVSASGS